MSAQEESLGILLADVSRLMRRDFQQRMEGGPLSFAQARALIYVARHEGVHQVELAELLEVQPITLARLIDHLSECGLVERRPDPADRRAYQIYLTADAAPRLGVIESVAAAIRKDALRGLSKEEADAAMSALRKMRHNLTARA